MFRHSCSTTIVCLWIAGSAALASPAAAQTPLKRATVSSLRNRVRLLPRSEPARKAKVSDVLLPGDGLSTARASLAELRFNDGTLARMGEHAVFRFSPKTRRFRLSNGTVLLLIPPGQGRTTVKTPNVTAGIRGSALFLRHDSVTNTTIVGALTNSGIEVMNQDGNQVQRLAAGQMVVAVDREIQGLFDFDLQEFYETSGLVQGLELDDATPEDQSDEAIAKVREETLQGLKEQADQFSQPATGEDSTEVLENPDFTALSNASPSYVSDFLLRSEGASSSSLGVSGFPGRSIGVNDVPGELDEPAVGQPVVARPPVAAPIPPAVMQPQPSVVIEPPAVIAPPVIAEPPVVVEPPSVVDPPAVIAPPVVVDPPAVIEPPSVVEPPVIVESPPAVLEPPVLDTEIPVLIVETGQEIVDPNPTFPGLFPQQPEVNGVPEFSDTLDAAEVNDIAPVSEVNDVAPVPEVNDVAPVSEVNDISDVLETPDTSPPPGADAANTVIDEDPNFIFIDVVNDPENPDSNSGDGPASVVGGDS